MNSLISDKLSEKLYDFGKELGFSRPIIRSNRYTTEIYIIKRHAIQLEIDWKEYDLFMYVVYIRDNNLPEHDIIYNYTDGKWCRKFIEEIYQTKMPQRRNFRKTYSAEHLYYCLDFYIQLIKKNPKILMQFLDSIDGID